MNRRPSDMEMPVIDRSIDRCGLIEEVDGWLLVESGCESSRIMLGTASCWKFYFLPFTQFHVIKINARIKKMFFSTLTLFTVVNPPFVRSDRHVWWLLMVMVRRVGTVRGARHAPKSNISYGPFLLLPLVNLRQTGTFVDSSSVVVLRTVRATHQSQKSGALFRHV
jgi:hypothetical protein